MSVGTWSASAFSREVWFVSSFSVAFPAGREVRAGNFWGAGRVAGDFQVAFDAFDGWFFSGLAMILGDWHFHHFPECKFMLQGYDSKDSWAESKQRHLRSLEIKAPGCTFKFQHMLNQSMSSLFRKKKLRSTRKTLKHCWNKETYGWVP